MSQITAEIYGTLEVSVEGSSSTITVSIGTPGPAGTNGTNGAAATIAVGTTTTLSPGSSATVTNAGTSSAAVFNFGIPAGQKGDTGDTGATGATGSPGAAATIAAGTTTTGAAGSSASVVNSGTSSAAVFDFTIPRGDKGDKGDTGDTGPAGAGVPAGGSTGQYLIKASNTDYDFTFTSASFNGGTISNPLTVIGSGSSTLSDASLTFGGVTTYTNSGITFNDSTVQTTAYVGGAMPTGGTDGQIIVKNSATNYDTVWADNYANQLRITARNETGATLAKGTVVYISGASGNKPLLSKAQANADATSAQTLGLVTDDIPNNQNGQVTVRGLLENLDTSAYSAGAQLYLSGITAGDVTTTKPSAPIHLVYIGIVTRSHATHGSIEVAVQNGYELHELHDVALVSPVNNNLLTYDQGTDLWTNKSAATLGLLTSANNLSELTATASTARTNLGLGTAATESSSQLVPSGGTTGQVLAKASGTNYDLTWATAGGGGGVDVQTFGSSTTSGTFTWTKPSGAKLVQVILIGAGSGGGSGARQATTSARYGGGGGAGGCLLTAFIDPARLGSTETVTVAAGSTGGASVTTDNTNGNPGSPTSSYTGFSNFRAFPTSSSTNGSGGTTTSGFAGNAGTQSVFSLIVNQSNNGATGTATSGNSPTGTPSFRLGTGGGGGGGAGASSTTSSEGGNGQSVVTTSTGLITSIAGGTGGTTAGVSPTAGTTSTYPIDIGGTGGGGGAYRTGVAGMAGANGGWPGGAGGGGSASDNGFASGAGGNGANGFAVIITYT